jgi:hypothetical protein
MPSITGSHAGGPAGLAALEARNAAERHKPNCASDPGEAAAERSARARANVIHLRLDD